MLLPLDYGIRNLARRPVRTALTFVALLIVVLLILVVISFIRGLERSLVVSGDPSVVLVYSVNSEENIESSAISASTPAIISASIDSVSERFGMVHASPELYLGTRVQAGEFTNGLGLVRGVTKVTPMVRQAVQIIEGEWPAAGEVIVGSLVAPKLGIPASKLVIGESLDFEGRSWRIAGRFVAQGSAFESEIWCNLDDFQTATKRQDVSLVAMRLNSASSIAEVQLFCKQRTDLELRAIGETAYYSTLQKHYQPVRLLAWFVVFLVSSSGIFAGMNMMYGAVAGRVREIAALQAIGYRRRAILLSLMQEGLLLAAAAAVTACSLGLWFVNGVAIRFTMGAFALSLDEFAILIAGGVGVMIGCLGTIPPATKALRADVASSLKAI
ncbi:ABC transporter permease [Pirellulaceae bacterium SH501]